MCHTPLQVWCFHSSVVESQTMPVYSVYVRSSFRFLSWLCFMPKVSQQKWLLGNGFQVLIGMESKLVLQLFQEVYNSPLKQRGNLGQALSPSCLWNYYWGLMAPHLLFCPQIPSRKWLQLETRPRVVIFSKVANKDNFFLFNKRNETFFYLYMYNRVHLSVLWHMKWWIKYY